jgi:sirohydrochlorin ferrochelatase
MRSKRSNLGDARQTGVILFAHGSRVEEANAGVRELAKQVGDVGGLAYVRAAFLEMAEPRLPAAIEDAVREGMRRLIIIPYFLTTGIHLRVDLPALISEEQSRYAGLEIHVGEPLEGHSLMPSLILARIRDVDAKYKSG